MILRMALFLERFFRDFWPCFGVSFSCLDCVSLKLDEVGTSSFDFPSCCFCYLILTGIWKVCCGCFVSGGGFLQPGFHRVAGWCRRTVKGWNILKPEAVPSQLPSVHQTDQAFSHPAMRFVPIFAPFSSALSCNTAVRLVGDVRRLNVLVVFLAV